MTQSCSECRRLWRERTETIKALLRLIGELHNAVMEPDPEALSRAKAALDEGTERCEAARLAFEEHSLTHE